MHLQPSKLNFEAIYDRYADLLYRVSLSCTRNREDAEDVVHDVFMRYLEHSDPFRDEAHRRAWLLRVAINRSRDFLRQGKVRQYDPLEEADGLAAPRQEAITLPIDQLPEKYREPILLHYYEGFSVDEVARILMLTPSAVKMRLARGREKLKSEIKKEENTL